VRWKPIVWSQEDHYAQWLGYPTREGSLPLEGSRLTLSEHPGETFVVTTVESGPGPGIVWLKPLRPLDSF